MKQLSICTTILLLLSACSQQTHSTAFYTEFEKSQDAAIRTISRENELKLALMMDKTMDPPTHVKARFRLSKMQQTDSLVHDAFDTLDSIRKAFTAKDDDAVSEFFFKKGNASRIIQLLDSLESSLLRLDELGRKEFKQLDFLNAANGDSAKSHNDLQFLLKESTAAEARLLLRVIGQNMLLLDNKLLAFQSEQVGNSIDGFYTYVPIVFASSNTLLPGNLLEIYAGVGCFYKNAMPSITINGKAAEIGPDGRAQIRIKAPVRPGEYEVPVVISFSDPDGKQQIVTKMIVYRVISPN